MITTSPMTQGLGDILALGLVPAPDCCGAGRKCKSLCKSARKTPAIVRGGCGCSGLNGLGEDLIDYALDYSNQSYDPNAEMVGYYDKPSSGTVQAPAVWSDIPVWPTGTASALEAQRAVYRIGGNYQATPQGNSMWPLLVLAGAAAIVLMAN